MKPKNKKPKQFLILDIDWENNLREAHNPKHAKHLRGDNRIRFMSFRKSLNSRIKEINSLILSGYATYKI